MQRLLPKITLAALLAATVGVLSSCAAEAPFAGNWKVIDASSGNDITYILLQVEPKDGKLQGKILAAPLLGKGAELENFKADNSSMQFEVKFGAGTLNAKAYAPKADAKNKEYLGSLTFGNRLMLLQFVKTDDKELTRQDAINQTDLGKQFNMARSTNDPGKQQAALKELLEQNADKPVAYAAYEVLLQSYAKEPPKDEELRTALEKFVKLGARFGPEVEQRAVQEACQTLARADKVSPAAMEFIRQAEKSLKKDTPPAQSVSILKSLEKALKKTDKEAEAKELEPRINELELTLDAEFEKTAIPFKTREFKGRKGESQRVALVELSAGAYCPPCVAADVAFDAALETYKPTDAVFLEYHVHIPLPDRLTNPDTLARLKFYDKSIEGTPTVFINGKATEKGLGGLKGGSKVSYNALRDVLDEALETPAAANVKLDIKRKGDKLEIIGDVAGLKKPGDNMRLRFVVVEEVVRYPGGNGQRLHHHVVRSMPGGADGFALKEAQSKETVAVDLAALKKSLLEYLSNFHKGEHKFLDDEHPLNLKHLKIVAFVQNDDTKEILQAAQVDVPESK